MHVVSKTLLVRVSLVTCGLTSHSQDPLNIDESSNVDDKALLWIYVNKIEKLARGGSWKFECKFCRNSYVGSHSRVLTHLLQEGKGIKGYLKVTPQQRANLKKLVDDCKERIKHAAPKPVPLPSSSRNVSSSSLDYDMSCKVPNATESDPKKRKGPLEKAFKNEAREQCDGEIVPQRAEDLVFVHTNLRLLSRRSSAYKEGPSSMWDVGGDQFDSLDEINLGRLEFEDLSLDEPELEAVLFGGDGENEIND
ncbi:hypothetical protein Bca101_041605 [Brassica carinata]